ncbi:MAG: CotH kinase family protein, partial [Thiobacillus sp.]|nr:CotH kinase family protein [Thiobacillus sp.]
MKKHSLNKLLITFLIGVTLTQGAQAESTQTAPAKPHSGLNKDGHIHAPARHWPADATVAAQAAAVREVPPSSEPGIQPPVVSPPAADYGLAGGTPVASSEIHLEMDARDAEVLFRKEPFDKSAFPVRLKIGNGLVAGEIAVKGSFSRRYLKKSLLITLPKGQTWQGHRRIALNAMATDPTQAREWLAWDLARALGMHIPRTGYKKL